MMMSLLYLLLRMPVVILSWVEVRLELRRSCGAIAVVPMSTPEAASRLTSCSVLTLPAIYG